MTDSRQYENGVADVLAYLLQGRATVRRNVYIKGVLSGSRRQVDVVLRGRLVGRADATVIVDCKRWGTKVDVADVGGFIDLVRDVGSDIGMIVTTEGATDGARQRARVEPGIYFEIMRLDELEAWAPPGTIRLTYRIPTAKLSDAERKLRNAGFRVKLDPGKPAAPGESVIEVFRHYGAAHPTAEHQSASSERALAALASVGIEPVAVSRGITIDGGTPAHRWLHVVASGAITDLKVLADTPDEAERKLDGVAPFFSFFGIPRSALSVARPDGWLASAMFTFLGK